MDIPIKNLVLKEEMSQRESIKEQIKYYDHTPYENRFKSKEFAFRVEGSDKSPFEFKIKSISAFYDENLGRLNEVTKRRAVFCKRPIDYGLMEFEDYDTGEQRYKQNL